MGEPVFLSATFSGVSVKLICSVLWEGHVKKILVFALLVCALSIHHAYAITFNSYDLGGVSPFDLNNGGLIVGSFQETPSRTVPYMSRTRPVSPLSVPAWLPTGEFSKMNDSGTILWRQGGQSSIVSGMSVIPLRPLTNGVYASPVDMNNNGVVGGSTTYSGPQYAQPTQATLWRNGVAEALGGLGGDFSGVQAINDLGIAVGVASDFNSGVYATLWDNGNIQKLASLGGIGGVAYDINNEGTVVGMSALPDGTYHATSWTNGQAKDLGTLGKGSLAQAINDAGFAVGVSIDNDEVTRAILYLDGSILDLSAFLPTGTEWSYAIDINNSNDIIVQGYTNGMLRGYFLEAVPDPAPVPEPATVLLLGAGLGALALVKKKKVAPV